MYSRSFDINARKRPRVIFKECLSKTKKRAWKIAAEQEETSSAGRQKDTTFNAGMMSVLYLESFEFRILSDRL